MGGAWEGDYDITEVDEYHTNDISLSAIKHAVISTKCIAKLVVDDTNELIKWPKIAERSIAILHLANNNDYSFQSIPEML